LSASRVVAASELPPPEAAAHGQSLVEMQADSGRAAGGGAQGQCGAHDKVGLRRHPGQGVDTHDGAIGPRFAAQRVAEIKEAKHCLQQMVAIVAPPHDVQEQVELGRRRPFAIPITHSAVPSHRQ
jgi:hypothetical protein